MRDIKILIYNIDKGGLKKYSQYLTDSLIKQGRNVILSNMIDYNNYNIVHIQFEHAVFPPFGLKLIPILIKLRIKKKKIVITSHTILSRNEIYSRNNIMKHIKKIILPINEFLMGLLSNKIIVHTNYAKEVMINDYKVSREKVEVIPHGVYGKSKKQN